MTIQHVTLGDAKDKARVAGLFNGRYYKALTAILNEISNEKYIYDAKKAKFQIIRVVENNPGLKAVEYLDNTTAIMRINANRMFDCDGICKGCDGAPCRPF